VKDLSHPLTDPSQFDILVSAKWSFRVGSSMRRREFITLLGGAAAAWPLVATAQQLIGAWRATNECFLAAFLLAEGGRVQAAYLSGERDDNAAWTWDGSTLRITSRTFPLDSFTGHLMNDRVEADYVWHDLQKDELHRQACVFEKFNPLGRQIFLPSLMR
jgi:hypothetical protein